MSTALQSLALGAVAARAVMEWSLAQLNRRHVLQHAGTLPEAFRTTVTPEVYEKSVQYTLAKNHFHRLELWYEAILLGLVLSSGLLPATLAWHTRTFGSSLAAQSGYLCLVGVALGLCGLPWSWYAQFRLEQRFGLNTTTQALWWLDRAKGLLLTLLLGFPLVWLLLSLAIRAGDQWWLWAWGAIAIVQAALFLLAPVVILPWFNKFTPLPPGPLRERLLDLARRTRFEARSIQVMDGSKRSRHSNAFFTGFGRFRKIVLFDTLVEQLSESELAAVLAHEIGHAKRGHVLKMMAVSLVSLLAGCYGLAWLVKATWFYEGFGFQPGQLSAAFLLFGLLAGTVTFWLTPLGSLWSRRYEYQADAYAAGVMGEASSLIGALRKLSEKNLSNLMPHPLFSAFYYSHPTLLERERELVQAR
jgi:STE24 endopeptidase